MHEYIQIVRRNVGPPREMCKVKRMKTEQDWDGSYPVVAAALIIMELGKY